MANMGAWACVTLGVPSPTLFLEIKHCASSWLVRNGTNPQAVANIAWACATLGVELPKFFEVING
jgi:hypothetical protein